MDGVGDVAASFHAVLRNVQAAHAGLDARSIDRLVRQSALRRPVPGVLVVHGSVPTWEQRLAVVCSAGDATAAVSHRASALAHTIDGFEQPLVEVTAARGALAHLAFYVPELIRHQVTVPIPAEDLTIVRGLRCTSAARTIVDLPAVVDDDSVRRAIDWFERQGYSLTWLEQVATRLRRPGHRGPKLVLAEIAERRRRGAVHGSWFEALVEELLHSPLLPPLAIQHPIHDSDGSFIARVDFAFPALRLAFEAQSRSFHAAVSDEFIDQRRENRAALAGWEFRFIGWADTTTPERTRRFVEDVASVRARDLGLGSLPLRRVA